MDRLHLCFCDKPSNFQPNKWRGFLTCKVCDGTWEGWRMINRECDLCEMRYTVSFYPDLHDMCDNCRSANGMPLYPLSETEPDAYEKRNAYFAAEPPFLDRFQQMQHANAREWFKSHDRIEDCA